MNVVIIMGRMVADAELQSTKTGKSVTSFTVAVDKYSKQGEDKQANFITVVAWDKTCEFVSRYFHKGDPIAIEGSLQSRKYIDKAGNNRTAWEVVAEKVNFCGPKPETGAEHKKPTVENTDADNLEIIDDDSLPF